MSPAYLGCVKIILRLRVRPPRWASQEILIFLPLLRGGREAFFSFLFFFSEPLPRGSLSATFSFFFSSSNAVHIIKSVQVIVDRYIPPCQRASQEQSRCRCNIYLHALRRINHEPRANRL